MLLQASMERRALLPQRVIRVLHRQWYQGHCDAPASRVVDRGEFPAEHAEGPAVGDQVVHHDEQLMIFGS